MDNDFSFMEILVIQMNVTKMAAEDIAQLIRKPIAPVAEYIELFARKHNVITFKEKVLAKEQKKNEKAKARQQQLQLKNIKSRQEKPVRISVSKANETFQRKIREEKEKYQTKSVDYSKMIAIRIDDKTVVYAKPGEDIEEVRKKALQRMWDRKMILQNPKNYVEVKKFKPLK